MERSAKTDDREEELLEVCELKTDWWDPDERRAYAMQKYRGDRRAALDRLVPKRVCPHCRRVRSKSRQWVIVRRLALVGANIPGSGPWVAVCRSCAMGPLRRWLWNR